MKKISLALFWHQHQPYYPDDVGNHSVMPWVRLHGTKDYYGMAMHIKEVPEFRCTINLVPSLLLQIEAYTHRNQTDRHLDISRMTADSLSSDDMVFLLDNFFMANFDSMIRPFPRYQELYKLRGFGIDSAEQASSRFSTKDIRDLQIWSNLSWIHELAFLEDSDLRAFRQKGKNWTENDKRWLLDKQMEILKKVIPLHKELQDSGQIEITTTPFYHPILPLLWDKHSAREAMPGCELPQYIDSYQEDATIHLKRAVDYHTKLFGKAPTGLWPSEGSVSQEIISSIADFGIQWIGTDEEILSESTNGQVSRDGQGHLKHPELLYRPWQVSEGDSKLDIIFRDHALSDLIGFHYQRSDAETAANDLIGKLYSIGRAVDAHGGGRDAFVPIILDGENCWEYYPDGGVQFLRTLYQQCVKDEHVQPVRVSEYLEEHPPTDHINRLFAGSWISHNFAIWIGHQEDRTAWDLLHQTREFLKQEESAGSHDLDVIENAWEEIYIAEGSDWFWWFGDDHSSSQDDVFDLLFRRHLQNVYKLLGQVAPSILSQPITSAEIRSIHSMPTNFLSVKVDGRYSYFEWIGAGHYESGNERGTMTIVTDSLIRHIYFGFDEKLLMLRMDTTHQARADFRQLDELQIRFLQPENWTIKISNLSDKKPVAHLYHNEKLIAESEINIALDRILELTVPFSDFKLEPDSHIQFYIEAVENGQSIDRAPGEGVLQFDVPSSKFNQIMWQA